MFSFPARVVYHAPHTGWLLMVLLVAVPFIIMRRMVLRPLPEGSALIAAPLFALMALAMLLPMPFVPWLVQRERGVALMSMMLMASVVAYVAILLLARWRDLVKRPSTNRHVVRALLLLMLLVAVAGGWINRTRIISKTPAVLRQVVREMQRANIGGRFVVTDGLWDDLWAASQRNPPVMINLALIRYPFFRQYLQTKIDDPRLQGLAEISPVALLKEWSRVRPQDGLALLVSPAMLSEGGADFEPDRGLYLKPDEDESLASWYDQQVRFWHFAQQLRKMADQEPNPLALRALTMLARTINDSGVRLDRAGMKEEALRAYRMALEVNPDQLSAAVNLLGLMDAMQRHDEFFDQQRERLEQTLSLQEDSRSMAGLFFRDGRLRSSGALEILEAFSPTVTVDEDPVVHEVIQTLRTGRVELALARCREAIRQPETTERLWVLAGMLAERAGDEELLNECIREMEARDASWPAIRMAAAYRAQQQGAPVEALRHAARVLRVLPNHQGALELMVSLRANEQDKKALLPDVERLLALDPGNKMANLLVGQWMMEQKRYDVAEQAYRRVLEAGLNPVALNNLACILTLDGRPEEALPYAQAGLAVAPERVELWDTLGRTYLAQRDLAGAGLAMEKALALDPNHLEALLHQAALLALQGQMTEAQQALEALRPRRASWSEDAVNLLREVGLTP